MSTPPVRADAAACADRDRPKTTRQALPTHWYKRFITECPICGRGYDVRERQFTPKPSDPNELVDYNGMAYDWCDAL